jgi:hypothetical protein
MSFTLSDGTDTLTLGNPYPGVKTTVELGLNMVFLSNGRVKSFDTTETIRTTKFRVLLTESEASDFVDYFENSGDGRGTTLELQLGGSNTGFFPFGPDLGDVGTFDVVFYPPKETGIQRDPWLRFFADCEMILDTAPSYSLPSRSGYDQGSWSIGTITGLMEPQEPFKISPERALMVSPSRDGSPIVLNVGSGSDSYMSTFRLDANGPNAAAVINYLVETARGGAFSVGNADNIYPFGPHVDENDTVTAKLASPILDITHQNYDQFFLDIKMVLESVS